MIQALTSPDCPWCGNPPHLVLHPTQALCGTETCPVVFWNPALTPAQNRATAEHLPDLTFED